LLGTCSSIATWIASVVVASRGGYSTIAYLGRNQVRDLTKKFATFDIRRALARVKAQPGTNASPLPSSDKSLKYHIGCSICTSNFGQLLTKPILSSQVNAKQGNPNSKGRRVSFCKGYIRKLRLSEAHYIIRRNTSHYRLRPSLSLP
jgi:hypothetical protein